MSFNPLSIPWQTAFWASDPAWSPPSDGGSVATWHDASGNGYDATQASASLQPIYHVTGFNGQPGVTFDGVDDYLQTAAFNALSQPVTLVVIRKFLTFNSAGSNIDVDGLTSTTEFQAGANVNGQYQLYAGSALAYGTFDTTPHLVVGQFNSTNNDDLLYLDGLPVLLGNAGTNTMKGLTLGAQYDGTTNANVQVAFVGLLGRRLTVTERQNITRWARDTYGIAITDTALGYAQRIGASNFPTATSTFQVSVGSNVTASSAGSTYIGVVKGSGGNVPVSISDTQGNTWTIDASVTAGSSSATIIRAYVTNPLTAAASDKITVTMSVSGNGAMLVVEFEGLNTIDTASTNPATIATTTNSSSGGVGPITAGTGDLVVAALATGVAQNSNPTNENSSFLQVIGIAATFNWLDFMVSPSTQSVSESWSWARSNYSAILTTYRAAGGNIKVFGSGTFTAKPVKVWDGSKWVIKPAKVWDGSNWNKTSS